MATKRAAVDLALRAVAADGPHGGMLALEGSGWIGDLDAIRVPRSRIRPMILPDSSAWIEHPRSTGSPVHQRLHTALELDEPIAVTEPVMMEVLCGATSADHAGSLRRQLMGFEFASVGGLAGFDQAASIYRRCRDAGDQLRGAIDCLIAAAAIRSSASVLALDRD